jgi:hypothetical protein
MSASGDLYRCPTCGASLSLEQLRGTDCPFCKTVFPHHARAAEHASLVNQVMAQQIAQANQINAQMWGAPPSPYGAPQVPAQYGAPPPQYGAPPPYGMPPHGNPYAQAEQAMKRGMTITFVVIGISVVVMVGLGFVLMLAR